MKNNKLKRKSGITLIALVITIIVMLILVAVTISMAVNGGLFEYAGKATADTNNAIREEQQLASGKVTIDNKVYNSIDEYLEAQKGGAGNNTEGDIQGIDGEIFTALYTETKEYKDKNNDTAMIPKGFSVGKSEEINTIDDGLVIQDAEGNQFVWIPVVVTETDTETNIASFYRSMWENNARSTREIDGLLSDGDIEYFIEPCENGYTNEEAEYKEMVKSVYENGGFYIGRYEAGSTSPRNETIGDEDERTKCANGTTQMIVKRDAYPYSCVGLAASMDNYTEDIIEKEYSLDWNEELQDYVETIVGSYNQGKGAILLSKEMYANKDVGVTSTLCYGIQWDAMLDFIKDDTHNVTNSITWGNYWSTSYTITRKTAKYSYSIENSWNLIDDEVNDIKEKIGDDGDELLLTTGASDSFVAKNIYDVAGNVWEWTQEAYGHEYETDGRVMRGGGIYGPYGYADNSPYIRARIDINDLYIRRSIGFRPVLYIK